MNVHKNAPLTPKGREAMVRSVVEGGLSQAGAADLFNTTPKTVAKWVKRFRENGVAGLLDRSSRPHSSPSQTLPATCTAIEALRRQRHTGQQIAIEVKVSPATVSRVLRRLGLNRIRDLDRPSRSAVMSVSLQARSFTSTSKSSGVSSGLVIASPAIQVVQTGAEASAGSSSTSALTTIPASLSRRSNRTRRWTARCLFSRRLWLIMEALGSPSRAS
ncbi:transposase [Bradyrhizobium sp. USDA 4469]